MASREAVGGTYKGDPEWGAVVRTALRERGISANAAASAIGVSPASLSSWLNGLAEPSLRDLKALAAVAGLPYLYILHLAQRIPSEFSHTTGMLLAEANARGALMELRRWSDAALSLIEQPPAAVLAGAVLERCEGLQPTLRPRMRGRRFRVRAQTYLGLQPIAPLDGSDATMRARVEEQLRAAMDREGAVWRDASKLDDWPNAPSIVLMVLDQERSHGPLEAHVGQGFGAGVIGAPYAHAELVASVVADRLGFGLINPLDLAQRRFGLRRDNDPNRLGMQRVIDEVLSQRTNTLRHVWTVAEPELLERTDVTRSDDRLIFVLAGRRLLKEGAEFWGYRPGRIEALAQQLELAAKSASGALVYRISDREIFSGANGDLDRDKLFDAAWKIGLEAASALTQEA